MPKEMGMSKDKMSQEMGMSQHDMPNPAEGCLYIQTNEVRNCHHPLSAVRQRSD